MTPRQPVRSATLVTALLLLVTPLFVAACGSPQTSLSQATLAATTGPGGGATGGPTPSPSSPTTPAATQATTKEDQMRIAITIGDQRFQATLEGSPASHDLIAQLPLTLEMADHGSVEKTGPLPSPLSLEGQPAGADPDVGDVGYYAPGSDFVLYYGDQSYYRGIVILGHLDGDAAERIADMAGSVTATIQTLGE